jgi:hypothetical protein
MHYVMDDYAVRLDFTRTDGATGESTDEWLMVPLRWQECRFGGRRPYFECPDCHSRLALVLYFRRGMFRCRECAKVTYRSCRERPFDRAIRSARKLRDLLGDDGSRPYGMWQRTYERITAKIDATEAIIDAHERKWRACLGLSR